MNSTPNILIINTGSTSTKIGLYEGQKPVDIINISHSTYEIQVLKTFDEKLDFRKNKILQILNNNNKNINDFDLIMCRGGLIKPVKSGVYKVNDKMLYDLKNAEKQHASNLAAVLGFEISTTKENVYIADPVVVDEMAEIARFAGHKDFKRISIFHALNHKAVARKYADSIDKKYEDLNLIVAHLGGGISIGAHKKGKVIDVNQALDGEGAFSPERSGTLPVGDLIKKAFSGKYTLELMKKMIVGKGGLISYLGTGDLRKIEADLNDYSIKVLEAMAYQISKSIGEMAVVLDGKIDAIILTGGVAYSNFIIEIVKMKTSFLSKIIVYPGEDEIEALAYNANLIWRKQLITKIYK